MGIEVVEATACRRAILQDPTIVIREEEYLHFIDGGLINSV